MTFLREKRLLSTPTAVSICDPMSGQCSRRVFSQGGYTNEDEYGVVSYDSGRYSYGFTVRHLGFLLS